MPFDNARDYTEIRQLARSILNSSSDENQNTWNRCLYGRMKDAGCIGGDLRMERHLRLADALGVSAVDGFALCDAVNVKFKLSILDEYR